MAILLAETLILLKHRFSVDASYTSWDAIRMAFHQQAADE